MTKNHLTTIIIMSPSDLPQCNIRGHQEMRTGIPEYRAYKHQGAVEKCLVARWAILSPIAMVKYLRDKLLAISSVSIYCISCRLLRYLSKSSLFQATLASFFVISLISKLSPRSRTPGELLSLLSPSWDPTDKCCIYEWPFWRVFIMEHVIRVPYDS